MQRIVVLYLLLASLTAAAVDSVVVFNEVHYHPATNEVASEWVELHNQMAVDIDLSAPNRTALGRQTPKIRASKSEILYGSSRAIRFLGTLL
jgi:hypothetical protein